MGFGPQIRQQPWQIMYFKAQSHNFMNLLINFQMKFFDLSLILWEQVSFHESTPRLKSLKIKSYIKGSH